MCVSVPVLEVADEDWWILTQAMAVGLLGLNLIAPL